MGRSVLVIHGVCAYINVQINDTRTFTGVMRGNTCPTHRHTFVNSPQPGVSIGSTRTSIQVILEAYADLPFRVGRDGQSGFAGDVLLVQIHVLLGTRVDDLNVDALVEARSDVRGNYHECICVGCIPNAFCGWVTVGRQGEFNGACGACEEEGCK